MDQESDEAVRLDQREREPLRADRLAAASAVTSPGTCDRGALLNRIHHLGRELRGLRPSSADASDQAAIQLARIEGELAALDADYRAAVGDAGDADHLPLEDCLDWIERLESMGLAELTAEGTKQARALLNEATRARREALSAGAPTPEVCFDALFEATTLEFETLSRVEEIVPIKTLADAKGTSEGPNRPQGLISEHRRALRQLFLESLPRQVPSTELRDRWANELADRANMLRTGVDDLSQDLAVVQLARMADDLDWHLTQVETAGGPRRARLQRKYAEMLNQWQDRQVQRGLERRLGRRLTNLLERSVFVLIAVVLVTLAVRGLTDVGILSLSPTAMLWLEITDAAACLVFLTEFFLKWSVAPRATRWFRRHAFLELLPSIPFGLIVLLFSHEDFALADTLRLGLALRVPMLARYILLLRPLVLLIRVFGLMARGIDRLSRSYGPLLNRNIILYPTRAERLKASQDEGQTVVLGHLWMEVNAHWNQLLVAAAPEARAGVVRERLAALAARQQSGPTLPRVKPRSWTMSSRELPAENLLRRMATLTPREVEEDLGVELARRLAWAVRLLARAPVRWLPYVRSWVPRTADRMNPGEVVATASRQLSAVLKRQYDRLFWFADLYGTVTPSVFVDRLGSFLVRSTAAPVYRLFLFGGLYLVTRLLINLFEAFLPTVLEDFLRRTVGQTLVVLGAVCFVILGVGWWLKRLAREATEFYERAAQAQFLALTENIRARQLDRDAEILYRRVVAPELALWDETREPRPDVTLRYFVNRMRLSLLGASVSGDSGLTFEALDRTVLLYRDSLDGALLAASDTRTTSQLLGNPALRQLQIFSTRVARREAKALEALDLERQKSTFGGPYLWFNLMSQSIAHAAARLIVDYNRNVIPLDELSQASAPARRRYEKWHAARRPWHNSGGETTILGDETSYVTTAFTALHFLDVDLERDDQVERRFGPEVLACMRRDRSLLIRRVFGTYPAQNLPKEERVLNLYQVYAGWFAGGRAILLPYFIWRAGLGQFALLFRWLVRSVREIRNPALRIDRDDAAEADFHSAIRKIHRMRGPVVEAAIRLRARLDPEYLGVPLPGVSQTAPEEIACDNDTRFLGADAQLVNWLASERRRAEADMARLAGLLENGLIARVAASLGIDPAICGTREHLRVAALAYLSDMGGVRPLLSAREILREAFEHAQHEDASAHGRTATPFDFGLWRRFRRYWKLYGVKDKGARKAAWRATRYNVWGVADALRAWNRHPTGGEEEGIRRLAEIMRHPGRITEQLVTLRAVQTLALLDVLNYRKHVHLLGDYEDIGDFDHLLKM